MNNWSTLRKKFMQTYIVIVSGSIRNVSTVHLNGIWHLTCRFQLKPVLGGHPVLSGHYSFPRGVNVHRELSTPVWIENVLSAEWNPGFVYNMECERIPCSRRSDSRARSFFFFFLSAWIFLPRLLSERLEQAKRLVNEYMCSMNYYDYYGLYYCCNYYN